MLEHISHNQDICNGLFLGPGSNPSTQHDGGKPKTEFMWQLLELLFAEDKYVKGLMGSIKNCTQQSIWTNKVKNKLKR